MELELTTGDCSLFVEVDLDRLLIGCLKDESVLVALASEADLTLLGADPLDIVDFFPDSLKALRRSSASSRLDCFAMSTQKKRLN